MNTYYQVTLEKVGDLYITDLELTTSRENILGMSYI